MPIVRWLVAIVALAIAPGCGDDDGPADTGAADSGGDSGVGAPDTSAPDLGPPGPGSWRTIYAEIVQPRCSCHLTGGGEGGLEMRDAARAHAALVEMMALTIPCNDRTRVVPGDAANSVLYQKISGENLCGPRMPLSRDPLPQVEIDRIRTWIDEGARND
ncbi:MAG: hypothetical protein IT379_03460 [Deltaproteobacteria bacterium]|nr:hypothetical protein [Deltaproteobacteria bacterium]